MSLESPTVSLPAPKPLRLSGAALFLDIDGTLAPIEDRPQDVRPDPRRTRLLEDLSVRLEGRLAVVSGRTLADVDRILDGRIAAVAALHGLVRRTAEGALRQPPPHPGLPQAAAALRAFVRRDPGLLLEDKGASLALHYRLARPYAAEARRLAARLAAETGLTLQRGDMVEELRTPGHAKGDAIEDFMRGAPFAGAEPVFVGDDVTDEHGFAAVARLGGFGVLVGRPRQTHARFGLRNVGDVLAWLEAAR